MTSDQRMSFVPTGPPWDVDVVADLHAGVYPPEVAAELRQRMAGDPEAQAVLRALSAVVDDLSLLPTMRMPEQYAARLDAAIAAEAATGSGVTPPAEATAFVPAQSGPDRPVHLTSLAGGAHRQRYDAPPSSPATGSSPGVLRPATTSAPRSDRVVPPDNVVSLDQARRRRRGIIGALGIAAAVAAIATVTVTSLNSGSGPSAAVSNQPAAPTATRATADGPAQAFDVDPANLQDAFAKIEGKRVESGPLSDPIAYASCISALGAAQSDILGVSTVTFRGATAAAVAVAEGPDRAVVYVVGTGCGPQGPQILAQQDVSR